MATKQGSSKQVTQSVLIGLVVAVVMSAGFYQFCYVPKNKEIESARHEVAKKEKALVTVRTQAPLLKPMTEKVKSLEQQLLVYRAKLAKKGEVISLIETIEGEAQRLGLKVINMYTKTVQPPAPKENGKKGKNATPVQKPAYAKVVLDSDMQADYYKLENFLSTLQDLESYIMIDSIDVTESGKKGSKLTLSFKLSLYKEQGVGNTYVAKK